MITAQVDNRGTVRWMGFVPVGASGVATMNGMAFVLVVLLQLPLLHALATSAHCADSEPLPPHALVRLGSLEFVPKAGETDRIEYSRDGKYVATAGFAVFGCVLPGVQIWERASGRDVTPLKLKGLEALGVSWGPDHRFITSHGSDDARVGLFIWKVGEDDSRPLSRGEAFSTVAWSPAGDRIAARTGDRISAPANETKVVLFDLDGKERHRLPITRETTATARAFDFTPDGKTLLIVSESGVEIHDVESGNSLRQIPVTAKEIHAVRVLPDGRSVAVATDVGAQIHPIDEKKTAIQSFAERGVIDCVATRDGNWLITTDFGGQCIAWDRRTGTQNMLVKKWGHGIAVSPDNMEIGVPSRRISFLKVGTWQLLPTSESHRMDLSTGCLINGRLWIGELLGSELREWDLETGKSLRTITRKSGLTRAVVQTDDTHLAVAGGTTIDIMDIGTGEVTATLPGHELWCSALTVSRFHRRLISAGADGFVRGWNLDSNAKTFEKELTQKHVPPSSLMLSPRQDSFALGLSEFGILSVHRIKDGAVMWHARTEVATSLWKPVAYTPDGRHLLSVICEPAKDSNPEIWFVGQWDPMTGKEEARITIGKGPLAHLAVSPDGTYVALVIRGDDQSSKIELWHLKNRQRLAAFGGHLDHVAGLYFTPDGKRLITISNDTTALVWDLAAILK